MIHAARLLIDKYASRLHNSNPEYVRLTFEGFADELLAACQPYLKHKDECAIEECNTCDHFVSAHDGRS